MGNQFEKLEAAKAAYFWLCFLTFPLFSFYLSLPILTFAIRYQALLVLTGPYFAFEH